MIKKELYLIKENPDLKNVYSREYIQYFNQNDKEFIKKVRDLGYKFLLIKTEITSDKIFNTQEIKIFMEISEDIIDPKDLLNDNIHVSIEPGVKND